MPDSSVGMECNLLSLHYLNGDASQFLWIKCSAQQDTFVTQNEDRSFSILKIKDGGYVSYFVLDPNLQCVFWDYEEASELHQLLYAQTASGDVLLYAVDDKGVTEILHISKSKLVSVIKPSLSKDGEDSKDVMLQLVGCDRSHIILCTGSCLFSVHITATGSNSSLHLICSLPLPQTTAFTPQSASDECVRADLLHSCYQILNGSVVIFDQQVNMIFMYSVSSGKLFCQMDLKPLCVDTERIVDWRMSHDLSVLMLLLKDWTMIQLVVSGYSSHHPASVQFLDLQGEKQAFDKEYLNYNLCRYGDVSWKHEVVREHVLQNAIGARDGKEPPLNSCQPVGFKLSKNQTQKKRTKSLPDPPALSYKSTLEMDNEEKKKGWNVETIAASSDVLTLVLRRNASSQGNDSSKAICFANFRDQAVKLYSLNETVSLVLSNTPTCSHMFLSDKFLIFVSPYVNLQKDDLISWMMSYSGPNTADSLCQANQWTRTAVPLHALEASIQQRQLDTLAFYFKSKQGLFSTAVQNYTSSMLTSEIQQVEDALKLVTTTVTSCLNDTQARMFAERLLSLTLDFVYGLLEDARQVSPQREGQHLRSSERDRDIENGSNILLAHIPALRKCMRAFQYRGSQIAPGTQASAGNEAAMRAEQLLPQPSVEMYVKENIVSSLQSTLLSSDENKKLHYRELVAEMFDMVHTHLEKRDISACQHILNNLGCNVPSTLWSLAQFYVSRSLQQFITSELSLAAALSPPQRQVVHYIEQLYKTYPNDSFSSAMKVKVHDQTGKAWPDTDDPLKEVVFASEIFLLSHCGEMRQESRSETSGQQSELYVALLLAWLSSWTEEMKQAVMTEAHFLASSDGLSALKSDPDSTWQFLVSHNLLDILMPLVESLSGETKSSLLRDATKYLHSGWSHLKRELARELLRQGKLNLEALGSQDVDLQALLPLVGGPVNKPHPLSYAGFTLLNKFHADFLSSCVRADLQLPFWMYCTLHGINPSELQISQRCSWLPLFQTLQSIPTHPTDKTRMLSASLMAAADLWAFSSGGEMTIQMMLDKNQVLAAVGTLCYMTEESLNLDAVMVEKYLRRFPKLMVALMPEGHGLSAKQNTTVYQLLMGTTRFDLRRLFGWHTTNSYAREDSPKVMPHFSESSIVASYSRHRKLAFPYYLKHGRPVFAFLSFLAEELDHRDSMLSQKRIQQACGAALWIACQNFNTPYISSACVVFVELLGRDSALVRAMIHSGRILLAHKHRNVTGGADVRKEQLRACATATVSDLQSCVRSHHRNGQKLISLLEVAMKEEIKVEGIGSCSFEASQKWMLVIMLCQLLSLPLSTYFLQACAEADNWLMFVWFSQLHQYPTHQLQTLLHSFQSSSLRDHLHYVLNNADSKLFSLASSSSSMSSSSQRQSTDSKLSQTQRASLYSRIGVQRSKADSSSDEEDQKNSNMVISSFSSRLQQNEFNESEMPESAAPDDVFRMLFHSRSMPCQWKCLLSAAVSLRNPLFAELAACCCCPPVPSICGWLLASISSEMKQRVLSVHGQQVSKWTTEQLEALIDATLTCGQEDNLSTAFTILQPLSPLLPFLCFVTECLKRGNYAACKTYMDQFKDAMASCDSASSQEKKTQSDVPTIGDRAWFEKVVYQVIKHELQVVSSLYHAKHLLEILDVHNMCLVFSFDVQDFALLHKVVTILHAHSVPGINLASLLTADVGSKVFVQECEAAVDYLVSCGKFSEAQELASVAGINREKVTISQLKEEKQRLRTCGVWTAKFVRSQYWDKCRKLMSQAECSPDACTQFFKNELQETTVVFEKAILCQHLHSLLEGHTTPEVLAVKDNIFRDMWRHHIAAKVSIEDTEPLDDVFDNTPPATIKYGDLKSDLVQVTVPQHDESDIQEDLTAQELEVLDSLIGNYLNQGLASACSEVAAVFGHYNQDLAIIQTCISLACKQCSIDGIEPAMKRLVSKSSTKRNRTASLTFNRTFSFTSNGSTSSQTESNLDNDPQEVTAVMEKLYAHCIKGSNVCLQVITCFKIAEILGMEYKDVVTKSEFDSLRQLLRINHPNKFAVARDFLATSRLSDSEVAGFLADSIVDVLRMFVKGNADHDLDIDASDESSQLMFNPSDGMEVFSQFMKLCENTALLGDHILQAVASLLSTGEQDMSAKVLTMQTELIIMAHECYTISSNMEGISHVLRAARVCCDCLAEAGEFTLMIRLLTGVGRYSEMLYIFHALQQHHQFELLLRKGMDREDRLKMAILDYLKRYQPDDSDAYTMVALKFTMYRDIAGMLEACGHKSLTLLKHKTLDTSKDIQELLKKCLQYFQDAAESYVKDNSVRKAQHCVKLARLLSLQMQLLSQGINVINLSREQVTAFINSHSRFIEAMVVSDAYERRSDWTEAVFNNVVINGDLRYLQEMKLHVHVTSTLVEDVVRKYKQAQVKPGGALTAIRKLLSLSKDAQLQYRLASELGLTDIVTAMLKGDTGCYLQDVTVIQ